MAHSLSSKKRVRQNNRRQALNRSRRSALRTKLRRCKDLFLRDNVTEAEQACLSAFKLLDREANRGTIHRNAAARRKSRMARRLNQMKQETAG